MKHFYKVLIAFSIVFGTYFYMDNSVERVQDTTIKDLTYLVFENERNGFAKKLVERKQIDNIFLNKMEKGGLDIDQKLIDALEKNPYVKNIKWKLKEKSYRGLDEVLLDLDLIKNKIKYHIKVAFFVKPKSSILEIFHATPSKLYPLFKIAIKGENETRIMTELDNTYPVIIILLYNGGDVIKKLLKNNSIKI